MCHAAIGKAGKMFCPCQMTIMADPLSLPVFVPHTCAPLCFSKACQSLYLIRVHLYVSVKLASQALSSFVKLKISCATSITPTDSLRHTASCHHAFINCCKAAVLRNPQALSHRRSTDFAGPVCIDQASHTLGFEDIVAEV